jgi:GH24 family phage-related lysozyme (muramidase)
MHLTRLERVLLFERFNMGSKLSKAVTGLILAGASAGAILSQFLDEKEGNRTTSYQDGVGIWTICRGLKYVDGVPVQPGMVLSAEKCNELNQIEAEKTIDWVNQNVQVKLTAPQIAGVASFCPYNIGPSKCRSSTFWKKLNYGDIEGACNEMKRWVHDGGKDCRLRDSGCYGQVIRRDQEAELLCWGNT